MELRNHQPTRLLNERGQWGLEKRDFLVLMAVMVCGTKVLRPFQAEIHALWMTALTGVGLFVVRRKHRARIIRDTLTRGYRNYQAYVQKHSNT